MNINVGYVDNGKMEANFNGLTAIAQSSNPEQSHPEPFDYFLTSTAFCARHFIRQFCETRNIPSDEIKILQESSRDPENKFKLNINLKASLPENFPEKYKNAVLQSVRGCSVKKVIETGVDIGVQLA